MPTMMINISAELYKQLEVQVRHAGTTPEELTRELLETVLPIQEKSQPQTAREVLQAAAGRIRPLSETLRSQIIPGVTLDEVRESLSKSGGSSLSDMIQEQRGPKA